MIQAQEVIEQELCWHVVMTRQRAADGSFVFAVGSTGIYCRPSCPARRPRREQVTFFRLPQEAEAAGFRPCRRCHPQREQQPDAQAPLVEEVCRYIETHLDSGPHLSDLGRRFHLSPYHLQRTFKRIKGISPRQYAESCRLGQFKARLQEGEAVTSAYYDAGYQSSSSVYGRTPKQLGMTPTAYRRGGKGTRIGYAIAATSPGFVLLAATERGIAAVRFGDCEAILAGELAREYPAAQLERDDEGLSAWITLLQQQLQGQPARLPVPLDVQASAFQWKVWQTLRSIPAGQTRSYREVAQAIGQPNAARAVARACATNPVAVFIPCHRVVRNNGQAGGYRWGELRKQQLLAMELAAVNAGDS